MVQRKLPNKLGIKTKPHHLKPDTTQLSSPQPHHTLNKIMKKSRSIKPDTPPFKNKKTPSPEKRSPNYMKSTTSFDARKESSPMKTPSPKHLTSLRKSPSFKPLRSSKKSSSSVMLCQDLDDAQRATCSSTLKDSKFPGYLQLGPGGTELDGTSVIKVCPYAYCSLNGHRHAPVPPLKSFLSARRRAMKTQKSFKLGCLSPRQTRTKPVVEKKKETENGQVELEVGVKGTPVSPLIEEESRDFFVEIYSKDGGDKGGQDSGRSEIDWEEGYGYGFASGFDDVREDETVKKGIDSLYSGLEEVYDEESVSSGAWLEEDGDYESDGSYQQMKIDHESKDQSFLNYDGFEVPLATTEADINDEMDDKIVRVCKKAIFEAKKDELQGLNLVIGEQDIKCSIDYQEEEISQESETVPDFAENSRKESDKRQTIIYNIIQFNISVFINGVKTEDSKIPANPVAADEKVSETVEEEIISNESEDENKLTAFNEVSDLNQIVAEKQEDSKKECNKCDDKDSESLNEEPSVCEERFSGEELPDPAKNLRGCKKLDQDTDDSRDFNPRGPNFLPEVADPDAETVDLRHQMMDERKNSEEWMVDVALQKAVTTLAPEKKKKVSLLVEAFEKVMPIPKYETHNRHAPKAFTNTRPMQACS